MTFIDGKACTIQGLLKDVNYSIDFYQRDYAWQERQIRELIDDLCGKFLESYQTSHEREDVKGYGNYFLGSVVISNKRGEKFIVDGQQRLTTLTLFLVFLHQRMGSREDRVDVSALVFSHQYGKKRFNLDVPERIDAMQALWAGQVPNVEEASASVRNLVARYQSIGEYFPEEISTHALPFFVDWLLKHVHFIVIDTYSDEDAYAIFETMNDRGLSLSLQDMLKGYILAHIRDERDQRSVNDEWKKRLLALNSADADASSEFFKNWFRARYAQTMRASEKGAENRDYERIGTEFHRWVRENAANMGLRTSDDFLRFVTSDLAFYAAQTKRLDDASSRVTTGFESVYFNAERGYTLQRQLILSALSPDDSDDIVRRKIRLVADFIDIWLARRVWNFRTVAYSSIKYTAFTWTKELRHRSLDEQSAYLRCVLDSQPESFAQQTRLRLHTSNYRQIRHILARMTYWVDSQSGLACHFEDLVSEGRARPFEIEHIWTDQYAKFSDRYPHPADFDVARNHIGGLLLLQRGLNQSLGGADYEAKVDAYATKGENLLARSLHASAYTNNPGFLQLLKRTGLSFKPYEHFDEAAQSERQELYIRLAEWIWNPSRLDLDGEKPAVHEPIGVVVVPEKAVTATTHSSQLRFDFWRELLEVANADFDLHQQISAKASDTLTARRGVLSWNYVALLSSARVECYIEGQNAAEIKRIFDELYTNKAAIESAVGEPLTWLRNDDALSSKIILSTECDLQNRATWPDTIVRLVDVMKRLYPTISAYVSSESASVDP